LYLVLRRNERSAAITHLYETARREFRIRE
jgi:hypothetical protein